MPFWDDTTAESPTYPVGDAAPVYRAVLDFLYQDGDKRPTVIVMHDSADGHMGGPCPFAKCERSTWKHKSKMDTSTITSYARLTRRQPRITQFGYPIPIVLISMDDVHRMMADGRAYIAAHPMPNDLPKESWGVARELQRKYPGAWGYIALGNQGGESRRGIKAGNRSRRARASTELKHGALSFVSLHLGAKLFVRDQCDGLPKRLRTRPQLLSALRAAS
ncbi:MAG TPA: hypothetical protein VFK26_11615 [Gemmatimonadaceae bacterium]|nr:hypothetical protein [Gemmatimonadaceae bacterium]